MIKSNEMAGVNMMVYVILFITTGMLAGIIQKQN